MRMALKDEQTGQNKHFINSLEFAWQGIKTVFREERNMRKHVAFGAVSYTHLVLRSRSWR